MRRLRRDAHCSEERQRRRTRTLVDAENTRKSEGGMKGYPIPESVASRVGMEKAPAPGAPRPRALEIQLVVSGSRRCTIPSPMPNPKHLAHLKRGVAAWNEWRAANSESDLDLREMNLPRANLDGANLSGANLATANLRGARLNGAILIEANLNGADLPRSGPRRRTPPDAKPQRGKPRRR